MGAPGMVRSALTGAVLVTVVVTGLSLLTNR
jgi:hypothetical protein